MKDFNPKFSLVVVAIVFLASIASFASMSYSEKISEIGCWTYSDHVICAQPNALNTTVIIKNVTCYTADVYETGDWIQMPCIADAELKPTKVRVCYRFLPIKNDQPDIEGYTDEYNCYEETWEGETQLQIPRANIPWECQETEEAPGLKTCHIKVDKEYEIVGAGNDVNGTKVIVVADMREKPNPIIMVAVFIVSMGVAYWIYKRTKEAEKAQQA